MNILIPSNGLGQRFQQHYNQPKVMIDVKGEPMLLASAKSLGLDNILNRFIFLLNKDHVSLGERITSEFANAIVKYVERPTKGAAETALEAIEYIDNDEELLIANCDQIMHWSNALCEGIFDHFKINGDAGIITIKSSDPKHSYIDTDTGTVYEKTVMPSNMALTGLHYWKHGKDFVSSAKTMIEYKALSKGEYYIGPVYNYFEGEVIHYEISEKEISFIGTPEDLTLYLNDESR